MFHSRFPEDFEEGWAPKEGRIPQRPKMCANNKNEEIIHSLSNYFEVRIRNCFFNQKEIYAYI